MGATFSDRLSQLGYVKARRLLVGVGVAVLAVVALVMYARSVDTVEVVATLLFLPIFLAFVYRGVVGGVVAALGAIAVYAFMRYPAIDAVGVDEFTGLIVSRAAAYLIFGAVGGWAMQVLEGSLQKLELYDEIDDETGLYNARHLLLQTDLEMSRAGRYQTLFSVVVIEIPAAPLDALSSRQRRTLLRDLGAQLREGARNVDHLVHAHDGTVHRLAAILPETAGTGAEVFRARLADRVAAFLGDRGADVDPTAVTTRSITFPGDEDAMDALRVDYQRIDAALHR